MTYSNEDLIEYRKRRAFESFEEAKLLAEKDHWNTVTNRLYYSCFYILTALFAKDSINTSTHNGVKSEFYRRYIKTGLIDPEFGKTYNDLFNRRQIGDYEDFQTFTEDDIKSLISETKKFLNKINTLL